MIGWDWIGWMDGVCAETCAFATGRLGHRVWLGAPLPYGSKLSEWFPE
jgi:hypothetical protein